MTLLVPGITAASLAVLGFCDPDSQELGWFEPAATWVHEHRLVVATYVIGGQALAWALRFVIGWWSDGQLDANRVSRLLDHIAEHLFGELNKDRWTYRATLFRIRAFPFVGQWLGMVARSGVMYQKRTTVFSIDPESLNRNTGMAGECWRRYGETIVESLPDVSKADPSDPAVDEYKKRGFLDDREYEVMSVKSRVFFAIDIRVKGKTWGILVLDTTDSSKMPAANRMRHYREDLQFAAVSLSHLISS